MRLSARGGMISGGSSGSGKGNFAFVGSSCFFRGAMISSPPMTAPFRPRVAGTRGRAPGAGGAAHAGRRGSGGIAACRIRWRISCSNIIRIRSRCWRTGSRESGWRWSGTNRPLRSAFRGPLLCGGGRMLCSRIRGRLSAKERERLKWIRELLAATRDRAAELRVPRAARVGDGLPRQGGAAREDDAAAPAAGGDRRAGGVAGDLLLAPRRVPVFRERRRGR